ncbi:hypothetical protein [Anaeromyxobacter terrae]|uniref:hypothetical protein n=1 Tax=Anaeromyxobacter terrae TaxID=2925406 RepID=UPI001F58DA0F|nr:hypothetical protein [Anaeromyxobacter sp. SG22]
MSSTPSCCSPRSRRHRRAALLVLAALAVVAPLLARSQELELHAAPAAAEEPEVVAEALFLCDTLPPGGRDLNLSLALAEGEPDPVSGEAALQASPRVQLAMGLGERVGFTADVGLGTGGAVALEAPGASLKLLLRAPDAHRTGLSASLDLFGSTHALHESEAGLGLGAIRALGRVALRASASVASGVSSWSPHLHFGTSAAIALGARWRALAEVVSEVAAGEVAVSAGPTLKVALAENSALMAGALFPVSQGGALPVFTFQLTQSM